MKGISKIEIQHFKGLYGRYEIDLGNTCDNLLLYGENGSGKSSICHAIKVFFEASADSTIRFKDFEHKFIPAGDPNKDDGFIKINFQSKGNSSPIEESLSSDDKKRPTKPFIIETNKLKAFLDYRDLLETHFVKTDDVDVFKLLVEHILFHYPNPFNGNKEIGIEWVELLDLFEKYKEDRRRFRKNLESAIEIFNDGIKNALSEVTSKANEIIQWFKYNLTISFRFRNIVLGKEDLENVNLYLILDYHEEKPLLKHHYFLNEARLTAIGISIFLASIKNIPQKDKYKILVLDDVFIGLDTSNRIPLLRILEDENLFRDYQIIMATYDRHWYEVAKNWLKKSDKEWRCYEMYLSNDDHKYGKPDLLPSSSPLAKAMKHFRSPEPDYPAAANYLRKEAENLLNEFLPLAFRKSDEGPNLTKLDNLINASISFCEFLEIDAKLFKELRQYKDMLLNPMSHYNIDYPVYRDDILETKKILEGIDKLEKYSEYSCCKLLRNGDYIRYVLEISEKGINQKHAYEGSMKTELYFLRKESGADRTFHGKISISVVKPLADERKTSALSKERFFKKLADEILGFAKKKKIKVLNSFFEYKNGSSWEKLESIPDDFWDKRLVSKKTTISK